MARYKSVKNQLLHIRLSTTAVTIPMNGSAELEDDAPDVIRLVASGALVLVDESPTATPEPVEAIAEPGAGAGKEETPEPEPEKKPAPLAPKSNSRRNQKRK
jgi:hypothetical protein